jgi:uncharacterized protein DUF5658
MLPHRRQIPRGFDRQFLNGLSGLSDIPVRTICSTNLLASDGLKSLPRRFWGNLDATVQLFIYFQALDLITTLLGFKLGASEASPFIRILMHAGPFTGVFLSKLLALGIGGACLYLKKRHLLRWVSYWYAGLVMWNLLVMLAALGRMKG